jgi:predicted nucleic acid-binding protein
MLKRKRLRFDQVRKGLSIFGMIPIQEMEVSLSESLELSARHELYAYDAYYLQLAKRSATRLLTLDQRMAQVAEAEKIQVKAIK